MNKLPSYTHIALYTQMRKMLSEIQTTLVSMFNDEIINFVNSYVKREQMDLDIAIRNINKNDLVNIFSQILKYYNL